MRKKINTMKLEKKKLKRNQWIYKKKKPLSIWAGPRWPSMHGLKISRHVGFFFI